MKNQLFSIILGTLLFAGCAHQPQIVTPKLEFLNQQVKANPKDAQAYSNRGYALALLGMREAARADLHRAVTLKNSAAMHNGAGWGYFNLEDYADALREWKTGADMSQRRGHYDYYSLALGYWGVGQIKEALENYQLAVEREPRFGEAKSLQERTAEWTPLEKQAIQDIYSLWNKTWKP